MSAFWPNEDGSSWTYDQWFWDGFSGEVTNQATFEFNGTIVVPGGIEAQNLEVEILGPTSRLASGSLSGIGADESLDVAELPPFWRNLWLARPDLRRGIAERSRGLEKSLYPDGFYQLLLHPDAFRRTAEEIAGWRTNVESTRAWLWLVADISIGSTFDLQLVPDLADDVWLHGQVAAREDVEVPAGHFTDCLRVEYWIDYGPSICTNEMGEETGAFRSETRGYVAYAPNVGPVRSAEEFIPSVEVLWGVCALPWPIGEPVTEGSLELASGGPIPVQPASWGRIKAAFR